VKIRKKNSKIVFSVILPISSLRLTIYHHLYSAFVHNGAKVFICSRKKEAVERAAKKLASEGPGSCVPFEADVSKESNCITLASLVSEQTGGKLDILVNNAGGKAFIIVLLIFIDFFLISFTFAFYYFYYIVTFSLQYQVCMYFMIIFCQFAKASLLCF